MITHAPRALAGRTVVVTRARHQAEALGALLEQEGARVHYVPMIRIVPPADAAPLRAAAARTDWDWIVFTSANAVAPFAEALEALEAAGREALPPRTRVLSVGPATAEALERAGFPVDLVPEAHLGEGVLEALVGHAGPKRGGRAPADRELAGTRILLPRAAHAREVLPEGLRARGATVEVVEAYRNVPETEGAVELRRLLAAGEVDIVTFTSSSTVRAFARSVLPVPESDAPDSAAPGGSAPGADVAVPTAPDRAAVPSAPGRAAVATIGPVTSATARELGLTVAIEADPYTVPALVRACAEWASHAGR
ncbi:MAG: uroporphyrinogen-III synthase [Gemmatimonadota bacterium]